MYYATYGSEYLHDPFSENQVVSDLSINGKVNAQGSCDFTIAPSHPLYDKLKIRDLSEPVRIYEDSTCLFDGYVYQVEDQFDKSRNVSCNGSLSYLGDSVVRPYATVKSDDDQPGMLYSGSSAGGLFSWYIDQHNQHTDSVKHFVVGKNEGSQLDSNDKIYRSNVNYPTTSSEIEDKLLNTLGGYIFTRYENNTRYIDYFADCVDVNAQVIDFGVNITDYTKSDTSESMYTVLIPQGATPESKDDSNKKQYPIDIKSIPDGQTSISGIYKSGDHIYDKEAVDKYGMIEKFETFSDIYDPENLLKAAALSLKTQSTPVTKIEVKAVDLSLYMDNYKPLVPGQLVRIRSIPHNIDTYMLLSEMTIDIDDPSNTTYTFGITYDTLTGQQSKRIQELNSSINSSLDAVASIDQVTKDTAIAVGVASKTAEEAKNTANTAKDTADTAKNTADTANTTANNAQSTANTAKNTADKAQTTAIAASNTAVEAKTTADSANNAAAELQKKTAEIDKQVEAVSNAADAASAKADQVRTDLTQQVQNVKSEMDSAVEAAQTSANEAQSAADAAQQAADKANASTVDLDKSIKAVDAKAIAAKQAAAEAQSKAENVESDLDSANAVIEQHTTELGELTTKVTNAVNESESALSVSTEAKQTATEASTTATSAYADAQTALTQSTTATQTATTAKTTAESASKTASDSLKQSSAAVQTANQISTTLRTEYQTKADADELYATQSSLKQTSDSITASVSKTYATKDALSALQNVADNAIESWRGTGVPTLTNKPASDWTTNADKKKHSGDLYYDKSTGKAYRFGSDDGETYTWELNQDTDVTKALENAAKAQTSANNAQASATAANTAADNAQSTANTAVSNAATAKNAADAAQSSANKAQGDVDKLKIDIPETYATKSSLTQTAESITANVESVKATANSAVTAASNAQQTADGISANLTKNYQTKSQADTIYATKASLKATSDSISAEVTKAQGTADGAVTAASKAQQTADAVTLNLSKNYQTKAQNDALYATQTSLEATSNSIKAEVAETYTTKNDFDNLTIGGTNRIILTGVKPGRIDDKGNVVVNGGEPDHCNTILVSAEPNTKYTISGSISTPNNGYVSVAFYDENGKFISRPTNAYRTEKESWKLTFTSPANAATMRSSFPVIFKGKIKLEKGDKPTDWSPAPEDLQPAGDYATNSSLTQTANSIKAEVAETYTTKNDVGVVNLIKNGDFSDGMTHWTTNGGTSKIVDGTYGKQFVFTQTGTNRNGSNRIYNDTHKHINGQSYEVSFYAKADKSSKWHFGHTSPKSASTTLDTTLKQYAMQYQADNTTVFSVWTDNPTATIYLERVKLSLASGYYATKTEVKQTTDSIKSTVSEVATTANSALSKATTVEQTANGLQTTVTEQAEKLDDAVTTTSQVSQRVDSLSSTITQVQGDVNSLNASVRLINPSFETGDTTGWKFFGYQNEPYVNNVDPRSGTYKLVFPSIDYEGKISLENDAKFPVKAGEVYRISLSVNPDNPITSASVGLKFSDDSTMTYNPQFSSGWHEYSGTVTIPSGKTEAHLRLAMNVKAGNYVRVDSVLIENISDAKTATDTANSALSKSSSVEQNLNSFKTSVSQTYETKSDALNKQSSLQQSVNNLRTEVSETYTTKNDFNDLTIGGRNLLLNSDFSKGTDNWVLELQNSGKGTVEAQSLSGFAFATTMLTINVTNNTSGLCRIYQLRSPNPMQTDTVDTVSFWANASESVPVQFGRNDDGRFITVQKGWHYYKATVPKWNGSNAFIIGFKNGFIGTLKITNIMWEHASKASQWSPAPEDLQPAGDYSTKSYVDQTAESVALGVVQNYKGADGSGLATKSDITVATDSITTTVSNTYQTKADMSNYATQSQLTQTNNKVTIAFQNSQSVGGRNLLLKTGVPTVVTGSEAANQSVAPYKLAAGSLANLPVGMYHLQFKIKSDTAGGTAYPTWNATPWNINTNKMNIGTEEQTYSTDYYVSNNNYPNATKIQVRLDNAKGNVTIREMKLEPGNCMTPWTAAPEDTMNDLTDAVQNQAGQIHNKADSSILEQYKNDTDNKLNSTNSKVSDLNEAFNADRELRGAYIQFGSDITSNPYMDMGNPDSPNKMHLTNSKMSFMSNDAEVAYISDEQLMINNAQVINDFRIGNFIWTKRADGHTSFKYDPK